MGNVIKMLPILEKVLLKSYASPIKIPLRAVRRHPTGESEAYIYKTLKGEAIVNYALPLITQ